MLPSSTHLMPVIGLDLHLSASGNPFHPYVGMVIDPGDYIPFLGSSVNINGLKRGVSDTGGMLVTFQHIPMFGGLVLSPIIGHESMNFFSSQTVFAEGTRLSPKGYMLMTCNDAGIPLSGAVSKTGKKKFKFTPTLFAPTAYSIPIPTGLPVIVGGPYAPDWGGALTGLLSSIGFSTLMSFAPALLKAIKKAGKKTLTAFNHKVLKKDFLQKFRKIKSLSEWLCKHGFEPVNLVNGVVVYEGEDFTFPSPIPLSWKRIWYSDSTYVGMLGNGVHGEYDRSVIISEEDSAIILSLSDGRISVFPLLSEDESSFNRVDLITLTRIPEGYVSYDHRSKQSHHFTYKDIEDGHPQYRLTEISDPDNNRITFSYSNSKLLRITDSVGRVIKVNHTTSGFISALSLVYPEGKEELLVGYSYDGFGNMISITDPLGKTTHIEYSSKRMVSKCDRNGNAFYWEYDTEGRCTHTYGSNGEQEGWISYCPDKGFNMVRDASGGETFYYYDPDQLVRRVVDPDGRETRYDYTESMELYRETDPEGRITGFHYDERGNLLGRTNADGTLSLNIYDDEDRMVASISPKGNKRIFIYDQEHKHRVRQIIESDGTKVELEYDSLGNISRILKGERITELFYDSMSNLIEYRTGGIPLRYWEYNYRGRLVMEKSPSVEPLQLHYDLLDRVTRIHRPDGNIITIGYDSYDSVIEVKDNDRHIRMDYTSMGSLKRREENGRILEFHYDKMEHLLSIINESGDTYIFDRNKSGDIIRERGFDGIVRNFTLNRSGEVIRIDRPEGRYTEYERNAFGRICRASYSDGYSEIYSYDQDGFLRSAKNSHGEVLIERDKMGRVVRERQLLSGGKKEDSVIIDSAYNQYGERERLQSNLGADSQQSYTSAGLLDRLSSRNGEEGLWESDIRYDNFGREIERFAGGDVRMTREYDICGRVVGICSYSGTSMRGHRFYSWRENDRLMSMRTHLMSSAVIYDYDSIGNLISSVHDVGEYLFRMPDIAGNIYKDRKKEGRVYGSSGQLLKDAAYYYYYDCEGNLILKSRRNLLDKDKKKSGSSWFSFGLSKNKEDIYQWQEGDTSYEWYGNGMLKSVCTEQGEKICFEYDALGRRILKQTYNTCYRYAWDGNVLLHEWNYSSQEKPRRQKDELGRISYDRKEPYTNVVTWVYDGTSFTPVAKLTQEDSYSIVQDYMGTPIQALDSKGEVVWDCALDIYGDVMELRGNRCFIPFRYQGQYEDEETGLYYNRFRYYSPNIGNYISQDPIGLQGGNSTLYAYVQDTNYWVDVWGLDCIPVKNKTKSTTNGLFYKSNTKHTPGQLGYRANAGIEPRNSMDLFNRSIPSSTNPKHRYTYDSESNTLHRFFSDNNGEIWHWSGSTNQGFNSIKGNQVPNDIKKIFNLKKKGW